ncbi:hypothetical protein [Gilliamella sp. Gris1-4]|uniref:hypothetical protein n=1 Tax=Gilliamella sp. Gris1-4 TaxID=3120244 RepID=UPI00080DFFFB|nr:hypothetical protein [Gilliamella apicola]OCG38109.1 hypothetical protein A9G31_02670 [Gilliamella apicola]
MEKLTPQNAHQEHMVQILLAKMQGIQVEYKVDDNDWCLADPDYVSLDIKYRIAPQPTPLPISREMWAMINEKWKWAVLGCNGCVYFFDSEPFINNVRYDWVDSDGWEGCDSVLEINIDGVSWRLSLTKRPEDV